TGAGDSFAGAFMSYLASQNSLNKNTIRSAVRYGTVLAAKCVSAFGVQGLIHQDFSDLQMMVNQLESWT
ncbi:MAG TPA: PfkB family carbohydrate kinase, partial [Candidatus Syntrophosphaera sp.]|nr:PfkB family carbohydrate kinase [Candidatus Syntrophosphaera sp.]